MQEGKEKGKQQEKQLEQAQKEECIKNGTLLHACWEIGKKVV